MSKKEKVFLELDAFMRGETPLFSTIKKKYKLSEKLCSQYFIEWFNMQPKTNAGVQRLLVTTKLGHKNEPYYTNEMDYGVINKYDYNVVKKELININNTM